MKNSQQNSRFPWRLAFVALLLQLCIGPNAFATSSAGEDYCGQTCPCDSEADSGVEQTEVDTHTGLDGHSDLDEHAEHDGCDEHTEVDEHSGCDDACPDDSDEQCPPDCDDCTCASVVVAVSLNPTSPPKFQVSSAQLGAPADRPANGVRARLFRPPKAS